MSALPNPIPVALCGAGAAVGKPVSQFLQPEYEVIHFMTTIEAAQADLPHLLAGRDPNSAEPNDVGTHNYSHPARVVLFGRAFQPEQVEQLRTACAGYASHPVVWIAADPAKTPAGPPGPGYAEAVVNTIKEALAGWKNEGGVSDGLILY